MKSKTLLAVLGVLVLVGLAGPFLLWGGGSPAMEEYRSFPSPDGRFRIVVLRAPLTAAMPGQAGDAPGAVRLYDSSGKLLHETKVEMVQLVDQVDWQPGRVAVKLVADWDLPQE
jgi:hypothetical protein